MKCRPAWVVGRIVIRTGRDAGSFALLAGGWGLPLRTPVRAQLECWDVRSGSALIAGSGDVERRTAVRTAGRSVWRRGSDSKRRHTVCPRTLSICNASLFRWLSYFVQRNDRLRMTARVQTHGCVWTVLIIMP
jgi:hypothetical protein